MNKEPQRSGTQLIDRSIAILTMLSEAGSAGARAAAVAEAVGLNAATVHRILRALEKHGWVHRDRTSRHYRLGVNILALGARAADGIGLRRFCRPALLSLTAQTEESVFLLVRSGLNIVCVDLLQGASGVLARMQFIGASLPLGVGVGSLAIMSCLPDHEVHAILETNADRYVEYGLAPEQILASLKRIQAKGYAVTRGEEIPGLAAVAAPLRIRGRDVVAAFSINMLDSRLTDERLPEIVGLLRTELSMLKKSNESIDVSLRAE